MFPGSSMVEQVAVNHLVVGSSPTPGASVSDKFANVPQFLLVV